jgi:ribonuclease HI
MATLTTDASPSGWGAILQVQGEEEGERAFGFWNGEQEKFTSNRKELWAVLMALRAFRKVLLRMQHSTILVRSDNSTVVADLNRKAATRTLTRPLLQLLAEAQRSKLNLTAMHIPGLTNTEADRLSRMGRTREYYVKEALLREATGILGLVPEEDAFGATPYLPSETALRHPGDALRMPWTGKKLLLHPPIYLLGRTLAKLRREPAAAILIVPAWRAQPWMPVLMKMMTKRVELGAFEEAVETTERFRREGWRLPPGRVWAVLLAMKMTKENASSDGCSSGRASPGTSAN